MRSLNETACAALLDDVRWDEPTSVASLAVLALIDVLVIAGEDNVTPGHFAECGIMFRHLKRNTSKTSMESV